MSNDTIDNSFIVPVIRRAIRVAEYLSLYRLITRYFWPDHERIPFWFAEAYVVGGLIFMITALIAVDANWLTLIFIIIVVYRLLELFLGTSRIIFIERERREDQFGHYLLVRHVERWLMLIMINFVEIIVGFSCIYLYFGNEFCAPISDNITALYQSILTFTTLGYGEIRPCEDSSIAKLLVILQLFYFLFFLLFVAPIILSAVRAKEVTDENFGE